METDTPLAGDLSTMEIKTRLARLESARPPDREHKTWIIVNGELEPQGIEPDDRLLIVPDEETRQLTQRIIAGEGT